MPTAYSYIRFSSAKQAGGDSLRRQTEITETYARKHKLTLDPRSYKDLGVSAFRSKNATEGDLGTFIQAIDQGTVVPGSYLLVEDFDRLSRAPTMTALNLLQTIIGKGITVVTLTDEKVYSTATLNANWTDLVVALAKMSRAHDENTRKAERVKAAWDAKRSATAGPDAIKLTAMGPGWLELREDRRGWKLLKDKVKTVRYIFELAGPNHNLGSPSIARRLNEEGVPMLKGANKRSVDGAGGWQSGTVQHILKNSAVIGTYTPKKADAAPIEGYYPAIIEQDVFYEVQAIIKSRANTGGRKGEGVSNLFSGISHCKACGSKMRTISASGDHRYLRCIKAHNNDGCTEPRLPYLAVEEAVLTRILNTQQRSILRQEGVEKWSDPSDVIKGEIASKQAQLQRYVEAIGSGGAGSPKSLVSIMNRLEGEIEALETELRSVVRPISDDVAWKTANELRQQHDALKTDPSKLQELTDLRRRMQGAIRQFIHRIDYIPAEDKINITFIGRKDGQHIERELSYRSFKQKVGGDRRKQP